MATIIQAFSELDIKITDRMILGFERMVIGFETRLPSHLIALNSQTIGIHPIAFNSSDRNALFELCGVTEKQVSTAIHQIPAVNPMFKVVSDPFNFLSAWLLHLAVIYISDPTVRLRFQLAVAKYLHYRFFTSLVNHRLPHGANEAVMTAVVNSLTKKFDIITYGSWRKAIEARCLDLLAVNSIHYDAIQSATPDANFLKIIYDTQTRIRDKVNTFCEIYYDFYKEGIQIGSKAATSLDREGEKILISKNSVFDAAITNITIDILNINQFVDRTAVAQIASQFNAISIPMLSAVLAEWSALATAQTKTHQFDYVQTTKSETLYIGARVLITAIIQTSFRYCITNRIPLTNKSQVWIQLRNVYSSSRVMIPDILAVKESVGHFIDGTKKTSRDSTKASLRLALIMFIVYKAMKYI